ncbi:hypothetical protein AVMA1855_22480 [Acidovorax sp. SUPP1855]|uniref:hypothetical protein n=1 Tax=Acidovorax sp. SUPP1855 TaxID=431774 RepID=UPI0023DE6ABB|nr:hypothetical protein [Acidovorax sp. SUPP1855]GKS86970.1 hypothetical protein AVMA1855_22480 [Acidovorax sp. SUPP1855]
MNTTTPITVQDKKAASEAYFAGKRREAYMEDLRNQSIAAFLVSHFDAFEHWLEENIQDVEIKCACVGFIGRAESQADKCRAILEYSEKMTALRSESGNAAMEIYGDKIASSTMQVKLDRLWGKGKPNPEITSEAAMEPVPGR